MISWINRVLTRDQRIIPLGILLGYIFILFFNKLKARFNISYFPLKNVQEKMMLKHVFTCEQNQSSSPLLLLYVSEARPSPITRVPCQNNTHGRKHTHKSVGGTMVFFSCSLRIGCESKEICSLLSDHEG